MTVVRERSSKNLAIVIALCTCFATVATFAVRPSPSHAQASVCPDVNIAITPATEARARASVACLINQLRGGLHLRPLRYNGILARVASAHAHDMVARRYFAHPTPEGVSSRSRVLRAHYGHRGQIILTGENIGWGYGSSGTPAGILSLWKASHQHYAQMANRSYREIGVGATQGIPIRGSSLNPALSATFTVEFGTRR